MPQVCSVGQLGAPLGGVCVLKLLLLSEELPWAVAMEELMGFSGAAFLVHCWDKQWWLSSEASFCPFRLMLGGRGFHGRAEEAAPVSLGSGLSYVPGWDFWPSVLTVGMRRLSQPASGPWVCWGLVWVQDVRHLIMDPSILWDQYLTLLNVHAHPACAGLKVGTARREQH